ncbi:DNRLRE domain-containing protein [Clostridium bovifaecis]|uniref:DNRLRE domain-containing protein n=1 Tax=Clostridium bovifaecis TaxID=2184719 RepID=A0A6I6F0T2_9CLOT|nr:DNRLRE domain-containing protein [Clostridium bovifaecis]
MTANTVDIQQSIDAAVNEQEDAGTGNEASSQEEISESEDSESESEEEESEVDTTLVGTQEAADEGVEVQQVNTDALEYKTSFKDEEDKTTLKNIKSKVKYENIEDKVNLEYGIDSKKVKESIVLNQKIENPEFQFVLNVKNLTAKLNEDKSVSFYDEVDSSKLIYSLESPFMYDSKGEVSKDIKVTLDKIENEYILTILPNKEWLDNENRAYPVIIDPTVKTSQNINSIHDSYVAAGVPNNNYGGVEFLQVGKADTTGTNRAYISFDLPKIESSNIITNAYLYLWLNQANYTPTQIDVHKVNSAWNSSTITWNNKPDFNSKIEDYAMVSGAGGDYPFEWDITAIAKEWTSIGQNNGLMIKNHNEASGYNQFISSDSESGLTEGRPTAVIFYTDSSGLENYWTYHSQGVGRAGTGYVNDYNGNLVFVHDDLSMNGNRMPISLSHVFNSNEKASSMGYGNGWRLNLSQRIEPKIIDGIQYYIYTDEDGTKHYLKYDSANNVYKDESGIDITMTMSSANLNEYYRVKDKKDNYLLFTSGGYLYKIRDNNNNALTLSYNGTALKTITDGVGRKTELDLSTGGYLLGVTDPSGRRTSYSYTGTNLTKITYPDGKYSTYTYDGNNNLTYAVNYDGYKIQYVYYTTAPYRVNQIKETNADGTPGEGINIKYGYNTTTLNDHRGKKSIYQFNDWGNTISIRDDDGNALYYDYSAKKSNGEESPNKLSLESKLQKPIMNYLKNHNAEITGNWTADNDGIPNGSSTYDTTIKYLGAQSLKAVKNDNLKRRFYKQQVTLTKGNTYTLSAYIKTDNISHDNKKGAAVFVSYQDESGITQTVYSDYVSGTNDWERQEVTFTLPAGAASAVVETSVGIVEESGTAYFDAIQLEDGALANRYNMLENPNFIYGTGTPEFWGKNVNTDSNDTLVISQDSLYPIKLDKDKKVFRINGSSSKNKNIYQKINQQGKANDVFVVSGWAKADSVPLNSSSRQFALDVGIEKLDGTYEWKVVPFNQDSTEWQYVSAKIKASADYKSLTFYGLYYGNENTAYFDGLQLYKEEFGESYQYDDKGNLISTQDLAEQKSQFEYSADNNLIKSVNPNGGSFTYKYDTKHNLTEATSAENVKYTFTYDSYGNPKTSKVGDINGLTIQSNAEYTTDGNYIKSVEDASGNKVTYNYNAIKGTLDGVTDAKGNTVSYSYDNMDRLTDVSTSADAAVKNSYTYESDRIKTVTHNGFSYIFDYDEAGNNTKVSVGSQNLITNNYEARTNKLLSSTYGNGHTVSYNYDSEDRISSKSVNGTEKFKYSYDASGNLGILEDIINGVNYRYIYDGAERLSKIKDSKGNIINYSYDKENNLSTFQERVDGKGYITSYDYDKDNRATDIYYNNPLKNDGNMEYFSLNNGTVGSKGTKPYSESGTSFTRDTAIAAGEKGKNVLTTTASTKILYDLGIKKDAGTMGVWFNTKGGTTTKYILASEGNGALLSLYLDSSNKLNLAVRDSAGGWLTLVTSTEAVTINTWNYGAFTWSVSGTTLNAKLYLNDKVYSGSTTSFKDFTGVKTAVGGTISGTYQLNGQLEGLSIYNTSLLDAEVNSIYKSGRGNWINYKYDSLGRLTDRKLNTGVTNFTTKYAFEAGVAANTTTTRVSEVDNNGKKIAYTYDQNSNIKTITEDGKVITYYYDGLNQLIREDNKVLNKTITYSYDAGGNILSKTEYPHTIGTLGDPTSTISYDYEDTNWKDKLTSYNEKDITYDAIGNPLTYDGYTFTWEQGRQLATMKSNDYDISFKYNVDGIRTEKTVNGVTTKYHLVGDKVTFEDNGVDKIYYTYDSSDNLVSMNLNGVEYYYIRNAQGDIIGLYDKDGTQVVSYVYDSWGKLISTTETLASTVGAKNPYRYRGYRYDSETGLYYLQSRYYNPEWGRFINADGIAGQIGELLGHNVFNYCKNDPVNLQDPSGFRPIFTQGEETAEMRKASFRTINPAYDEKCAIEEGNAYNHKKSIINTETEHATLNTVAAASNMAINARVQKNIYSPKLVERGVGYMTHYVSVETNLVGRVTKFASKYAGIFSVAQLLAGAVGNLTTYGVAGGLGRTAIDVATFGTAVAIGIMFIPEATGAAAVFAATAFIGTGADYTGRFIKQQIYGDEMY